MKKFLPLWLWAAAFSLPAFAILASTSTSLANPAPATSWDQVYDPFVVRSLNVLLSEADWQEIQADETFSIEKKARFWVDGETQAYTIDIRRKSATPIGEKISYKVDFGSTRWNDLKNMSLENGDDNNVVSEGFSWILHRLATNANYKPGLAAWTSLTVHVERQVYDTDGTPLFDENGTPLVTVDVRPQGLYLNVEQPDKQFLRHRGVWKASTSYLYKQDDIGFPELKESPTGGDSRANALKSEWFW